MIRSEFDAGVKKLEESGRAPCLIPPEGWACTREVGHAGPCAALPITPATGDASTSPDGVTVHWQCRHVVRLRNGAAGRLECLREAGHTGPHEWVRSDHLPAPEDSKVPPADQPNPAANTTTVTLDGKEYHLYGTALGPRVYTGLATPSLPPGNPPGLPFAIHGLCSAVRWVERGLQLCTEPRGHAGQHCYGLPQKVVGYVIDKALGDLPPEPGRCPCVVMGSGPYAEQCGENEGHVGKHAWRGGD